MSITFSDGERMIICMICDLAKRLPERDDVESEFDYSFIGDVIASGNYWALSYKQLDFPSPVREEIADETLNIMQMWDMLEFSFKKLSESDQNRVCKEIDRDEVLFRGFDGNIEPHFHVALFAIRRLGLFPDFGDEETIRRDRDGLNTHFPVVNDYLDMLKVFRSIKKTRPLSADEIIEVFQRNEQ